MVQSTRYFKKESIFVIVTLMFLLSISSIPQANAHGGEVHDNMVEDHCEVSTDEITIEADPLTHRYQQDEYQVKKNTCYKLIFKNPSDTEHDLQIDAIDDEDVQFASVHIHIANKTDGPNNDGIKSMKVLTPDKDMEIEFYCTIEGHVDMMGTLIVGEGDTSFLPINYFYSILGIITIILFTVTHKLTNKSKIQ